MGIPKVDISSFERDVLASSLPVIVDFYAEWCPPCFAMAELLEELSREYAGKVRFIRVDVDENEELAERYDVATIPTLAFFCGGELVDGVVGVISREALTKKLEALLQRCAGAKER